MTDQRRDQDATFYIDDDYNTLFRYRRGQLDRWTGSGWEDASVSLGRVLGIGGDGHARRVSREVARAYISGD